MSDTPEHSFVYGPLASRRLGQSIGINNVPSKVCSYSCVYCQVVPTWTLGKPIKRGHFYNPNRIIEAVQEHLHKLETRGEEFDYLTFVPNGEPTLDINLGKLVHEVKGFGYKVAVITNSTLLYDEKVRQELYLADWVSIKVDSLTSNIWKEINNPNEELRLEDILEGIRIFAKKYTGFLATETMLVKGYNDKGPEVRKIAKFISELGPDKAYISIPTRPSFAREDIEPADEDMVNMAFQIFFDKGIDVEYLIGYEGNAFASTGNPIEDILAITAVHPMTEEQVNAVLEKGNSSWEDVEDAMDTGDLVRVEHRGKNFIVRKIKKET